MTETYPPTCRMCGGEGGDLDTVSFQGEIDGEEVELTMLVCRACRLG